MYFSAFPENIFLNEVFVFSKYLSFSQRSWVFFFSLSPCFAKLDPISRHHFFSEYSHDPSSSTSRRTTRSISATS